VGIFAALFSSKQRPAEPPKPPVVSVVPAARPSEQARVVTTSGTPIPRPNGHGGVAVPKPVASAAALQMPQPVLPRSITQRPMRQPALPAPRSQETLSGRGDAFNGAGEITLTLGDVLPQIPSGLLAHAAPVDLTRPLCFPMAQLSAELARGRPAVPLASIAQQCPDIFHDPEGIDEAQMLRLPLQKLLEQIGRLKRPHSDNTPRALPPVRMVETPQSTPDTENVGLNPQPPARTHLPSWLNANGAAGIPAQTPVAVPESAPVQQADVSREPLHRIEPDRSGIITAEIIEIIPAVSSPVEAIVEKPAECVLQSSEENHVEIIDESKVVKAANSKPDFNLEASAPAAIKPPSSPTQGVDGAPERLAAQVPVAYEVWAEPIFRRKEVAPESKPQPETSPATPPAASIPEVAALIAKPVAAAPSVPVPFVIPDPVESSLEIIPAEGLKLETAAPVQEPQAVIPFEVFDESSIFEESLIEIVDSPKADGEIVSSEATGQTPAESSAEVTPLWSEPLRLIIPEPAAVIPPSQQAADPRQDPEPHLQVSGADPMEPMLPWSAGSLDVDELPVATIPVALPESTSIPPVPAPSKSVRALAAPSPVNDSRVGLNPVMPKFPLRPPRLSAKLSSTDDVKPRPVPPRSPMFVGRNGSVETPDFAKPAFKAPPLFGANPLDRYFSTKTPPPVNWGPAGTLLGISGDATINKISDAIFELPGVVGCMLVASPYLSVSGEWPDSTGVDNSLVFARRLSGLLKRGQSAGLSQRQITTEFGVIYAFAIEDVLLCAISLKEGVTPGIRERLSVVTKAITYARKTSLKRMDESE
jgi:hypothetical protein